MPPPSRLPLPPPQQMVTPSRGAAVGYFKTSANHDLGPPLGYSRLVWHSDLIVKAEVATRRTLWTFGAYVSDDEVEVRQRSD